MGWRVDLHTDMRDNLRMAVRTYPVDRAYEPPQAPKRIPVNLSLPVDLVNQLDRVAGPRNRSGFAEAALRRAIRREQFHIVATEVAGSLKAEDYPHWRTSEDVVAWVREMRAEETDYDDDSE